jgi:hypothetical protein
LKCKNCGDEIRRTQPGDGIPADYEWVHVYPLQSGGEIANPICDITLVAEPPDEGGEEVR